MSDDIVLRMGSNPLLFRASFLLSRSSQIIPPASARLRIWSERLRLPCPLIPSPPQQYAPVGSPSPYTGRDPNSPQEKREFPHFEAPGIYPTGSSSCSRIQHSVLRTTIRAPSCTAFLRSTRPRIQDKQKSCQEGHTITCMQLSFRLRR